MQQTSNSKNISGDNTIKTIPSIMEYLEESGLLKKTRAHAESRKIPIIDDCTGRFLEFACQLLQPLKILEIGCGTGYSTYFLLKYILPCLRRTEVLPEENNDFKKQFSYTGIDLNKERLDEACMFIGGLTGKTIMRGSEGCRIKNTQGNRDISYIIEFIHGDANKILKSVNEKFDMVFIDAAKFQYPYYLEAISKKLQNGCAVIADNIFYCGKIFREEIIKHDANSVAGLKEYICSVTGNSCFKTSFFDIGDGLAFSVYNK